MINSLASILYLTGLVFAEILRLPQRVNLNRNPQEWNNNISLTRISEMFVIASVILGIWVFPIGYIFTEWLNPLNYSLSSLAVWFAAGIFFVSLLIRWNAQRTLATQWSFTVETRDGHALVTSGIYSYLRHPIYVSLILWAIAQPNLLQNYLAGFSGCVSVLLIWIVRIPREERLMLKIFGDEYRQYIKQTGLFFPRRRPR